MIKSGVHKPRKNRKANHRKKRFEVKQQLLKQIPGKRDLKPKILKPNIFKKNSNYFHIPLLKINGKLILDTNLVNIHKKLKKDLKFYVKAQLVNPNINERYKFIKIIRPYKIDKKTNKKILNNNKFITQKKFITFLSKNNLYNNLNLRQDFPYPNYLQTKSEIQRATIFRDLMNKEEAYYNAFTKSSPLVILLSPKPKNIYMTVYTLPESETGYKIYWKKSTGMLEKVEGQLSFPALVDIFNKLNIFLAKRFATLQNPIRLIIKSTKYYGTNHLIQNFVKMHEKNINLNYIYFMYKYRKRFNFFNSYATLINDSVFNYISSIWLRFLKLLRRSKLPSKYSFSKKNLKVFNKFFGIEYDFTRRRHKMNHFARLKRLKSLKNKKFKKKVVKLISNHVAQR
jgi:hypothetical protein